MRSISSARPGTCPYSDIAPTPSRSASLRIDSCSRPTSCASAMPASTIRSTVRPRRLGVASARHSSGTTRRGSPAPVRSTPTSWEQPVGRRRYVRCTVHRTVGLDPPSRRTMSLDTIRLRGVRQHNLRGIDLDLAKRSLVVVVGVSGSGKSSLVFDTIAAEAQRQVNATFSAFAQNFLPSYGRPDADRIENLSAVVVVDQRPLLGGPRSTVATATDIGARLRMLYSRAATPSIGYSNAFSFNDPAGMCPRCHGLGQEKVLDVAAFVDESRSLREGPFRHPEYRPGTLAWRRYADSGLFDVDVPLEQYSARERHLLLEAEPGEIEATGPHALPGDYEGVLVRFRRIQLAKDPASLKGEARKAYDRLVTTSRCSACEGTRLNEAARTAQVAGL